MTSPKSLHVIPLLVGALVTVALVLAYGRFAVRSIPRGGGIIDLIVIGLLLPLAIPDVVVFRNPVGIPNLLFDPASALGKPGQGGDRWGAGSRWNGSCTSSIAPS